MRCPHCQSETAVIDSRLMKDGSIQTRRRQCKNAMCAKVMYTQERFWAKREDFCNRGHRITEDNPAVRYGQCRQCRREYNRQWMREKRAVTKSVTRQLSTEL